MAGQAAGGMQESYNILALLASVYLVGVNDYRGVLPPAIPLTLLLIYYVDPQRWWPARVFAA